MSQNRSPVLIVGGGPVGLSLALFLHYWGVPCTILNTAKTATTSPKGNTNNARTLEIFRQIGIIDEIRSLGRPKDHPSDVCFYTRLSKHEIHRHHMPSQDERLKLRDNAPATDQYVEPIFRANHMYIEQYLHDKVQKCQTVDARFGYEAKTFSQDDHGVTVTAVRTEDGDSFTFSANFLVDCSGGRSMIRKGLGIRYTGDVQTDGVYMAGQFLNARVRIPELYSKYPKLKTGWFLFSVNADKTTRGILGALNGKDEFVLITKAGDKDRTFTPNDVIGMIRRSIGDDEIRIEVLSHVPWKAGAAMSVDRYQADRIFLAGDAAHLFTPVGGFGMNTGIDDVHNLAWKLAAVIRGWGGQGLLDSYQMERQPIGVRNTTTCRKSSSTWHDPEITTELELDGPEGDKARLAAAKSSFVKDMHFCVPEEDDFTGIQLGSRYDGSPLIFADGEPPLEKWPDTFVKYTPTSVPGGRLPHLWLEDDHKFGDSIYDQLAKGFTLLRLNASVDTAPLTSLAAQRGIPLGVLDVARTEAKSLYKRSLLLVRPDWYVAWRGDELPTDCNALLDRICGLTGVIGRT